MCVRLRGKRPKTCDEVLKFKIKIISHLWSYVMYGMVLTPLAQVCGVVTAGIRTAIASLLL